MKKVEEAIEQMNRFKLIDEVDDSTTHVVCGDSRRTLNVMRGVVRGAKIVTLKWVRGPSLFFPIETKMFS